MAQFYRYPADWDFDEIQKYSKTHKGGDVDFSLGEMGAGLYRVPGDWDFEEASRYVSKHPGRSPLQYSTVTGLGQGWGMWPTAASTQKDLTASFKLLYAPDHATMAGKVQPGKRIHVRIENKPDDPKVGGVTTTLTTDASGVIKPSVSVPSNVDEVTKYISLTPLNEIPGIPKDKAFIWRYPFKFTKDAATDFWFEPGGGVQPTFPGAPQRAPKTTPSGGAPTTTGGEPTNWVMIGGIAFVALGAGFLLYQLYGRKKTAKSSALRTPRPVTPKPKTAAAPMADWD